MESVELPCSPALFVYRLAARILVSLQTQAISFMASRVLGDIDSLLDE
jgi:hypothetical protein